MHKYTEKSVTFNIRDKKTKMQFRLEIYADSFESAINAWVAGADRVKLLWLET